MRFTILLKVVEAVKMLLPENVLLLIKSVEEAAVMVMAAPTLRVEPLMVPSAPEM